jgi:YbbR domain-containing protein
LKYSRFSILNFPLTKVAIEPQHFVEKRPNMLFFKHVIRKIFLEDWLLKLVALVITFALWLGVTGLSTPTTTRMTGVPLTLRFSNNTEVTNSPIQEVDIVISGDKRKIAQINKNDLIVSIDLTDVIPGERVIQLTPENVSVELPTGVRLEEIQPNKIAVKLESVEEKDVAVKTETQGEIPEGFEVYSEIITPAKVRVRGPASFIRSLTSLTTEKIDLANRNADFTARQIPVNVSNPRATLLETVVDVAFRIGEKRAEKIFLVNVKDAPGKKATVVLFGPRSLFDNVKAQDLQVEIVKNESGEELPQLVLPAELQNTVETRKLKIN